jgi:hypothetical protein
MHILVMFSREMARVAASLACAFALGLGGIATAAADDASEFCSLASLHGSYAWSATSQSASGPTSSSGMESYDGAGHMKWYNITSNGAYSYTSSGTGTYTIGTNCIATVTYDYNGVQSGLPWTYFVAPDGSGYYWNNNQEAGTIAAGRVDRISHAQLLK